MGAVLAKFRKEKTTEQKLEHLEERIKQIEKYSLNTQEQKKRFVGNFLAISIGVYVIAFIVFYFVYFPPTWNERMIYSVPLFLFPVVIILLRRVFTWYFQRKLNKNSSQLSVLRTEKKKILEQVMDKETYKVAVNLLARFGDKTNGNKLSSYSMTPRPNTAQTPRASLNQSLRALPSTSSTTGLRPVNTSLMASPRQAGASAAAGSAVATTGGMSRQLSLTPHSSSTGMQELRRRTPFPIVNQQDKTIFERMVDVLIGDGPQDRFAMICKECFAHNGMAPKEEFDYATFRCAFCNALNPSRKARPIAPRLPEQVSFVTHQNDSSDSSSDDTDSDSDLETFRRRVEPSSEQTESDLTLADAISTTDSQQLVTDQSAEVARDDSEEELKKETSNVVEKESAVESHGTAKESDEHADAPLLKDQAES